MKGEVHAFRMDATDGVRGFLAAGKMRGITSIHTGQHDQNYSFIASCEHGKSMDVGTREGWCRFGGYAATEEMALLGWYPNSR